MQLADIYKLYTEFPSVQTDSRKVKKDDLFFALKGPSFNGNLFAAQALASGAAYAITDEDTGLQDDRVIRVDDCLDTLQQLAKYHRMQFKIPFIAITGSNGKTTTKELAHAVLSSAYKTYTTEGNLNNHIGIPLTILKVKNDAEIAIIEMGANHQKEIAGYCTYTLPTHGLITNCGKAHLEGFGGEEGIRKGKGELFDHLRAHHGTAFIMKDYEYLQEMSRGIEKIISYGTHDADITGQATSSDRFLEVEISTGKKLQVRTQLVGDYNLPNVLAAVALGSFFNIPGEKIKLALEQYTPSNSRSQLLEKDGNHIILDAYNANPSSMKAAVENFAAMSGSGKILMLGAMKELGEAAVAEHQALADLINTFPWEKVILVGGDFKHTQHDFLYLETAEAARDWYKQQKFSGRYILIKGSRGIQMEKILQ